MVGFELERFGSGTFLKRVDIKSAHLSWNQPTLRHPGLVPIMTYDECLNSSNTIAAVERIWALQKLLNLKLTTL